MASGLRSALRPWFQGSHRKWYKYRGQVTGTKDIPILVVTAQVMAEDRERCEKLGVSGFVMKPIDLDEFSRLVDSALRQRA